MCRMLAVLTAEPTSLAAAISAERGPFTKLAGTHKDGWGVLSGEGPKVRVEKSIKQALGDPDFESAIDTARGTRFIAHIRRASKGSEIHIHNTHPFVLSTPQGDMALSHHGQFVLTPELRVSLTSEIRDRGGEAAKGDTDSELYLHMVMVTAAERGLDAGSSLEEWARAVQDAAAHISRQTEEHISQLPEALNTLFMTPRGLVAYEQWDESTRGKYKALDTYQLRYLDEANRRPDPSLPPLQRTPARVLVASQGWDQSGYTDLPQLHALTVEAGTLATSVVPPLES